jgi:hypothetical protein
VLTRGLWNNASVKKNCLFAKTKNSRSIWMSFSFSDLRPPPSVSRRVRAGFVGTIMAEVAEKKRFEVKKVRASVFVTHAFAVVRHAMRSRVP